MDTAAGLRGQYAIGYYFAGLSYCESAIAPHGPTERGIVTAIALSGFPDADLSAATRHPLFSFRMISDTLR